MSDTPHPRPIWQDALLAYLTARCEIQFESIEEAIYWLDACPDHPLNKTIIRKLLADGLPK